ncbi:TonB-dependent siderophore receptor [Corticibacter populi]|uniref:TonB-dependent siderophore receptor n=1 Tax=Corticibacter populi TaxID=1550736 RepID=A0A3M6QNY0_9BURK|nr:FepA family TonB-dependent siderophore receptor [Corticibacter populi]RMX04229.1 TonB-dependent siderophore receptor [Corticibacter populi]RZS33264.1 ferric enterobactin receptor [Corticibacter populi]
MLTSHQRTFHTTQIAWAIFALAGSGIAHAQATEQVLDEVVVLGTAEEEVKQSLGVSVITAEDLAKRPPASDLSEVLRQEPGVNLTGSANSGMRGNRRQLDIRGMGPDNTLVLIDGQPASSRNASRQGWTGERDSDGDTAWVPPEMIERVEILRGPAAARYGSGAMGGVVNIITKRPTDRLSGSLTYYTNLQQDPKEGDSRRANFSLSGPISDRLAFRVYGGYSKTEPDALNINAGQSFESNGVAAAAGKTGNRNKNINGLFTLDINAQQKLELNLGYSRKSDLYSGDSQNMNAYVSLNNSNVNFIPVTDLYGTETTVVHRSSIGLTHRGDWDWGDSRASLTYGYTRNARTSEGLFGGPEGAFLSEAAMGDQQTSYVAQLKELRLDGEVNLPGRWWGKQQVLTLGAEIMHESLDDAGSTRTLQLASTNSSFEPIDELPGRDGRSKKSFSSMAVYAEDNIELVENLILTPALRLNYHKEFGFNASPGLTASYALNRAWTIKGGIARAYKTPSLYQANPNYLLFSQGTGCRAEARPCYLQGNADLEAETSINKEIGIAYDAGGLRTSVAYFRNDYKNKISAGTASYGTLSGGAGVLGTSQQIHLLKWENTPKAVVQGLEGNLFIPLTPLLDWNTNFTYMIESEDKSTGQPLSIIPKYTVNSTLDWLVTDKLSLQGTVTWYGKQEAATHDVRRDMEILVRPGLNPYALVGVSGGYEVSRSFKLRLGVNNLFNKQLYREGLTYGVGSTSTTDTNLTRAGARTYNEHGRSFFISLTGTF